MLSANEIKPAVAAALNEIKAKSGLFFSELKYITLFAIIVL